MPPERQPYEAVLESLADGADVNWAALESSASTSAERRRYSNLRLVARIAELHRTLPLDEEAWIPAPDRGDERAFEAPSTWGHLRVGERIASGAYGEIYVAHDPQLNRDVALKMLRRSTATGYSLDQLLAEARTLAKVRHANVVTIHGADVRDGRAGLWMELVQGETLETSLHTRGRMGAGEASALGADVCRALAAVHAAGLVHGDIKAQNVMRENGGRIVLMDFGAGRAQDVDAAAVAGTPLYLAPEVLAGEPPTTRSDVYSVGVLLFHLLTGGYPCIAGDLDSLRAAHADGVRVWLRDLRADLPDPLVETIERALDPDPARRFATAGEMERALTGASQPAEARRTAAQSRLFGFAIAATAFLAVVAALIVWSRAADSRRGVTLSEVRSIGVLPMVDLSGAQLPDHFPDGLTDELIATLGQSGGLTVKPALLNVSQRSLKDVARSLDVDALLQTTVSTPGDGGGRTAPLRVRATLISAGTAGLVWTQEFERPRGMTLELPGMIASAILRAVHVVVTPAESSRLSSRRPLDPAAEEAYLQGLFHLGQYGVGDAEAALAAFRRALQREPNHAGAHAGAAQAHLLLGINGADANARARADAFREIRLALEADDQSVEAHTMLGYLRFDYDWDFTDGEREFQRSIELNRSYPFARVLYADSLAALRRFDEALAQVQAARTVDPTSGEAARRHALILYYKRDYDAADRVLEDAERLDPSNAGVPLLKARFAEARGRFDDAVAATTAALERAGGRSTPLRLGQARRLALAGHRNAAIAALQVLESEAAAGQIHLSARDRGYMYLALGDRQQALRFFGQAVDERDPTVVWFAVDPRVDTLRRDPRFRELLKIIGLPLEP